MSKFIDITGQKFNKLTVVKRLENSKNGSPTWLCKCECGNFTKVLGKNLKNNAVKSCGCLNHISHNKTHGLSKSKIYNVYKSMKSRCYNKNNKSYKRYGGRDISVCQEWKKSFENFYKWSIDNGYKDNLTIDRIDNNGNYCPENCRWTTFREQCRNRRTNAVYEYNGEKRILIEWCEIFNMDYKLVHSRINKSGWSFEKAITTPKLHK